MRDASTGFVGIFQATMNTGSRDKPVPFAFIRPYGGGHEVTTAPDQLREPTPDEILSAKLAAQNQQSRERAR